MEVFLVLMVMYAAYRFMDINRRKAQRWTSERRKNVPQSPVDPTLPPVAQEMLERIPRSAWKKKETTAPVRTTLETVTVKEKAKRAPRPRKPVAQTRLKPKTANLSKSRYADRSIKKGRQIEVVDLDTTTERPWMADDKDIRDGILWQQLLNEPVAYRNRRR